MPGTRASRGSPTSPGFDLYPLNACQADLTAVYDAQRAFVRAGGLDADVPVDRDRADPAVVLRRVHACRRTQLNAEVWLAVIGGARGIGYFTHTWTPDHHAFDVAPALQQAMEQTNACSPRSSRACSATTVRVGCRQPGCQAGRARRPRSHLCLLDQHPVSRRTKRRSTFPQLHDGTMTGARRSTHGCRAGTTTWSTTSRDFRCTCTCRRGERRGSAGGDLAIP